MTAPQLCESVWPVSTPTDVVREFYETLDEEGLDSALSFIGPAAAFEGPMGSRTDGEAGRALIERHFRRFEEMFDPFHTRVERTWAENERVLVQLHLGGRGLSGAESWRTVHHLHTVTGSMTAGLRILRPLVAVEAPVSRARTLAEAWSELSARRDLELSVNRA